MVDSSKDQAALRKEIEDLKARLGQTQSELEDLRRKGPVAPGDKALAGFMELLPVPATILALDSWSANYFNGAFIDATGYSKENCHSRSEIRNRLYPDPAYRREIESKISDWEKGSPGRYRSVERKVTISTGEVKTFIYHAIPFREKRFLTLWFDITERKQAEEKLRESNHFIETVISSMGQGFMVYDPHLRYVKWNRFMENLTGRKEKDVLGKPPWEIFIGLEEKGILSLLKKALAGETVQAVNQHQDMPEKGSNTWVSATYTPTGTREAGSRGWSP